ncbi:MAG: xylulokinase [Rhodospirillales bacterium]|nr:xylulokinase [Rhodospirillales bacterium]
MKALLTDSEFQILDRETVSLPISRPHPLWSEQSPEDWWTATRSAIDAIKARRPKDIAQVRAIGLAGQMHGAVLLDKNDKVLRPAILWNDGRCAEECALIEQSVPDSRAITGNIAMPGFTAPKLLWVKRHEPDIFAQVACVLLPKDYIRFRMTGEKLGDMSDCAGTLWLDVNKRCWSDKMLAACDLSEKHMPKLCEGDSVAGTLRSDLAERWGMNPGVIFAGGGGDNAAGAVGIGAVRDDQAFISLGTSGVYFVATNQHCAAPERTVHAFCHALTGRWHQMGVILSAASCVKTATGWLGAHDEAELCAPLEKHFNTDLNTVFLPYLSGERTPHNNPNATGCYVGMTHDTMRADLAQATLEGVAFAFADCQDALEAAGARPKEVTLIGGGSRNDLWGEIIASVLNKTVVYVADGDQGPAFGAAKLAALAHNPADAERILARPSVLARTQPNKAWQEGLRARLQTYRDLYTRIFTTEGQKDDGLSYRRCA